MSSGLSYYQHLTKQEHIESHKTPDRPNTYDASVQGPLMQLVTFL